MSLVYTTLLSLVPLIALSFSVLKGFGVDEQVEPILQNFFKPMGEKGAETVEQIMEFVNNVNFKVLGAVGLGFLIYTVISLVQKVEESFNYVWQVERSRSFARRFSEYLSVILVGPLIMFTAAGLLASITSDPLIGALEKVEPFGTTIVWLGKATPYILVIMAFSFFYSFVPNTRVKIKSALTGGAIGGMLWATAGFLFASFVSSSTTYSGIYKGFAIMILALIWLYLSWLILLFGAQIAFYHQNPQFLRRGRADVPLPNRVREKLALLVMFMVGKDFRDGGSKWTVDTLATRIGVPGNALAFVLERLLSGGLLLETERGQLVPGRDIETLSLSNVFGAVRAEHATGPIGPIKSPPVEALVGQIDAAIESVLDGRNLRDFIVQNTARTDDTNTSP